MSIPPETFDDDSFPDVPPSDTGDWLSSPDAEVIQVVQDQADEPLPSPQQNVEDITVAELIGQLLRAPGETFAALVKVLTAPPNVPVSALTKGVPARSGSDPATGVLKFWFQTIAVTLTGVDPYAKAEPIQLTGAQRREAVQLGLRLAAFVIALYGSGILATERTEQFGLHVGAPYLLLGFVTWIGAELFGSWPSLVDWWQKRSINKSDDLPPDDEPEPSVAVSAPLTGFDRIDESVRPWWMRMALAGLAAAFSVLTILLNFNNQFTLPGVIAWAASIGVWVAALAPDSWTLEGMWAAIRKIRIHRNWTLWALLLIMLLGAYFRVNQLNVVPPEMTSDHVEKLLDAQVIVDGTTRVFFPNNGGREPMQFYTLAFLSEVFSFPLTFLTLKVLTVIEGLISIPLLWWMGREVIGSEDRKLGNLVGLMLAGLVAVSYWHVALSRLGLRIILTVIFTALLVIFLSRALRYNRRGDFIKAGLVLGFGLYAYQAVRMLPVVILIGVGLAIVFHLLSRLLKRRREEGQTAQYVVNLATLVLVSVVVFVPLLTFSFQYPDDFWRRTSGRLLGDDLVQTTDASGNLVQRVASLDERMAAFGRNWPILANNIRNALLMYNWKGDVAWINAAPNHPTMDVFTASLFIIGLAAWLMRMIRRRDAVDWLMPIMLFVMLLPSALSIAYPVENPSATRTSGTLPEAYLFAALPLALIVTQMVRISPRRGTVFAIIVSSAVLLAAYNANQSVYFGDYVKFYTNSSLPYSDAGKVLKGFSESGGSYGNAYMIAYPYWWDHRAIGLEAGLMDWPNGIINRVDTPRFMYLAFQKTDQYRLDPDKDLLFFYSVQDVETEQQLKEWFPGGYAQIFQSYQPEDAFKLYRVPAMGASAFISFLREANVVQ
jgi:hypothetical protein